jgi:hypothetical protein
MSYYLVDARGYLADLASINGYADMRDAVKAIKPFGQLAEFLANGETTDIANTINDLDQILPQVTITSVKSTLEELKNNLIKAHDIVIVTQ